MDNVEGRKLRTIPYLARKYKRAHDRNLHVGMDYYDDDISGILHKGDVVASPVRCKENRDTVRVKNDEYDVFWTRTAMFCRGLGNQMLQDHGIIYERQNKGIPMLHILGVKPQYGSEDHVKYSWKLDEATKECKLEIDQFDKNEQGKKTIKFPFATDDTDKLLSQVVDGYEVKYMLRTDAIRFRLELEMVLSTPDTIPDFDSLHGKIMLATERDGIPYTVIDFLHDKPPSKKPKLNHSNNTFKVSFIRIIPRSLPPMMRLTVKLKDSTSTLDIDDYQKIFPYNIPVDQRDYIHFENGYIRFKVFWGCTLRKGKGICTGVCTCEPVGFIGFTSPVNLGCSSTNEE